MNQSHYQCRGHEVISTVVMGAATVVHYRRPNKAVGTEAVDVWVEDEVVSTTIL